jgi:hypothetical protein
VGHQSLHQRHSVHQLELGVDEQEVDGSRMFLRESQSQQRLRTGIQDRIAARAKGRKG